MSMTNSYINDCIDIYQELKDAQWLVQSMKDALSNHWEKKELVEHLSFLVSVYDEKLEELIPRLDAAFEEASSSKKSVNESSIIQVPD